MVQHNISLQLWNLLEQGVLRQVSNLHPHINLGNCWEASLPKSESDGSEKSLSALEDQGLRPCCSMTEVLTVAARGHP